MANKAGNESAVVASSVYGNNRSVQHALALVDSSVDYSCDEMTNRITHQPRCTFI